MNDDLRPPVPAGEPLSSEQLERVIRRAAELQTVREDVPERLADEEVLRIGQEVGLEARHVKHALLELRAESLVPSISEDRPAAVRLWGLGYVQATRVVPGDAAEVQDALSRYLRSAESLRPVRDRPGLSVWEPASDLASQLKRSLDFGGHGFELAKARRIEMSIQQLEPGRSLVTLSADLRNERAEHASGFIIGLGLAGAGISLPLILVAGLPALLVAPVLTVAGAAGGSLAAARTFRSRKERVKLVMNGLLDRLERGSDLPLDRSSIVGKITGFLDRMDEK